MPASIIFCLASAVVSSALSGKWAKRLSLVLMTVLLVMSTCIWVYTAHTATPFVYVMGNFPAPWGNELRGGMLEGLMATFFCVIMLLSILGGLAQIENDVDEEKENLYFIMIDLLTAALMALIYTNDLFTGYVFIEINTIAAGALIMFRNSKNALVAATKYMTMSLLGSGLILMGLSMLYGMTGHLLMSNIHEAVTALTHNGHYGFPLTVVIALLSVGLAIKSALFPFHSWLPDAYGHSTATSAAILSSLVSKSYIFLLIKIFYRVIGTKVMALHGINTILFVFGVIAMIAGSVAAIKQVDVRKLIAYSSVAQIGYIYMGIGMADSLGMIAAVFHILAHASTKSMLFIAGNELIRVSDGEQDFHWLKGAGYRNKLAGVAFTVGALSMVGIPLFAGFTSKVYFAEAAFTTSDWKMIGALLALAISTILNAIYFIRVVISIYTPNRNPDMDERAKNYRISFAAVLSLVCFIVLNFVLGLASNPIEEFIKHGLALFG